MDTFDIVTIGCTIALLLLILIFYFRPQRPDPWDIVFQEYKKSDD